MIQADASTARQGMRPLIVGAIGEFAIGAVTLGMVVVADATLSLG